MVTQRVGVRDEESSSCMLRLLSRQPTIAPKPHRNYLSGGEKVKKEWTTTVEGLKINGELTHSEETLTPRWEKALHASYLYTNARAERARHISYSMLYSCLGGVTFPLPDQHFIPIAHTRAEPCIRPPSRWLCSVCASRSEYRQSCAQLRTRCPLHMKDRSNGSVSSRICSKSLGNDSKRPCRL
ncbi:hypothetical protein GOBAR_AA08122 [Gossypium barbadense]|uniref:Uncharacterized protein n=1 Tax=Gossypium barbadense TaxID=3634 RepID=A0A2P5YAA6_GOSBA|nr:hypothetical protein GOBAR_AA08122 [Gossypium barbadense]